MAGEEHNFGSGEAYSIGVEEELFLVDPVTGRVLDAIPVGKRPWGIAARG